MRKVIGILASLAVALSLGVSVNVQPASAAGICGANYDFAMEWWANTGFDDRGVNGSFHDTACSNDGGSTTGSLNTCTPWRYDDTECGDVLHVTFCPSSGVLHSGTWNDCISSLKGWFPNCHTGIKGTIGGDGSGISHTWTPGTGHSTVSVANVGSAMNDGISRLTFVHLTNCD